MNLRLVENKAAEIGNLVRNYETSGQDKRDPRGYAQLVITQNQLRNVAQDMRNNNNLSLGDLGAARKKKKREQDPEAAAAAEAERQRRLEERRVDEANRRAYQQQQRQAKYAHQKELRDAKAAERAAIRANKLAIVQAKEARYQQQAQTYNPYGYGYGYGSPAYPYTDPMLGTDPYGAYVDMNAAYDYSDPGMTVNYYGAAAGSYSDSYDDGAGGDEYDYPAQLPQLPRDVVNSVYNDIDSGGAYDTLMGGFGEWIDPAKRVSAPAPRANPADQLAGNAATLVLTGGLLLFIAKMAVGSGARH